MRLVIASLLLAGVAWGQSVLSTPVTVLPKANGSSGSVINLQDLSGQQASISSGFNSGSSMAIFGKASGNGSILLFPGNVAGASSVEILSSKPDVPNLIISDQAAHSTNGILWRLHSGSTTLTINNTGSAPNPTDSPVIQAASGFNLVLGAIAGQVVFEAPAIPESTAFYDLGTTSLNWNNLYAQQVVLDDHTVSATTYNPAIIDLQRSSVSRVTIQSSLGGIGGGITTFNASGTTINVIGGGGITTTVGGFQLTTDSNGFTADDLTVSKAILSPSSLDMQRASVSRVTIFNSLGGIGGGIKTWSAGGSLINTLDANGLLTTGTVDAGAFKASGTSGLSATVTVRNSAGSGTCTLIFTSGLKTGGTC